MTALPDLEFIVSDLCVDTPGGAARLSGISFRVANGGRVALSGPSGMGKTTLLRALAWLDSPRSGLVTLNGRSPLEMGVPSWRRRVAMVAQRPQFFSGTVREELARPFSYRVSNSAFDGANAEQVLARLGVDQLVDREALRLSEGEKQRVSLVRTLLLEPSVILLDEPTSALDSEMQIRVETLLAERAIAQIWVTHDRAQCERIGAEEIDLMAHRCVRASHDG